MVGSAMVRVRLLGELEVEAGGKRIEPPASRRAWSLLAWLALHPGEHPRSAVAAAFWPDVLDSSARASLRSAAWVLRRALGPAAEGALTGGRDRIGLRCETDLARFEAAVAAGELEAAAQCPRCAAQRRARGAVEHVGPERRRDRAARVLPRMQRQPGEQAPRPAARRRLNPRVAGLDLQLPQEVHVHHGTREPTWAQQRDCGVLTLP